MRQKKKAEFAIAFEKVRSSFFESLSDWENNIRVTILLLIGFAFFVCFLIFKADLFSNLMSEVIGAILIFFILESKIKRYLGYFNVEETELDLDHYIQEIESGNNKIIIQETYLHFILDPDCSSKLISALEKFIQNYHQKTQYIQILLLNPFSEAAKNRAIELASINKKESQDGKNQKWTYKSEREILDIMANRLDTLMSILKELEKWVKERYPQNKFYAEIKLTDKRLPFAMYKVDETVYCSIIRSDKVTTRSPQLKFKSGESDLKEYFENIFVELWEEIKTPASTYTNEK